MTPSKILFCLCLSLIAGIFIESAIKMPQIFIWGILILGVLTIFTFSFTTRPGLVVAGFCVLFLVLGILRMQISQFNITNDKLSKLNGKGEVALTGVIYAEPDVRDTYQKLKVKTDNFESFVLVAAGRYPEYKYLDRIKITGKLEGPGQIDDFSYKNYLMKDGIYSVMNFPKIDIISRDRVSLRDPVSFAYSGILWLKAKLRESIQSNFSLPQRSIIEGTILGDNGAMSNDLKNKLNITGLRHVIAVSGTHVVILASILISFLMSLKLWRGQAFYIVVIFIILYIVLTGLPASGVRAGIMGILYLLAQKLGRQGTSSRIIIIAGSAMLLQNPLLLFYDIGFQLSFLAVFGLIYFEPLIRRFLSFAIHLAKDKVPQDWLGIVSTTFAAQIFTLPVMVYNFGNISFVSLITNILILPIVYYLMLFGFLSSVAGIFLKALGWLLSLPCYFFLNYFLWVINFFSQSWAIKYVENVHWIWLVISYLIIGIMVRFLNKKFMQKFA